ncbi:hypothetical protein SELMODRAFT_410565 [Selaginella moellendorffii]|uniref:Uncharacterized protein n=1 Tax=Selaginella moellendorffii TaxID=88036 RepID=D8RF55_SELML|nr:hypothetical protein SELMODRAFT_410565 [Selaginella moellendorffii]
MAVGSKLYVFGGTDGTSTLDGLFVLDNATNTWGKPDVFGDVPAPREGHSTSLIGDNLFMFEGYTFVWKKISTTGVLPIPQDSHTCSSYKNCFVVTGGEDGSNPETMAWWERLVFGRLRIPLVPGLLHVSPLQEIPWMQSKAYYSSMRDVTKSLKLWMTCISLLLTLLPFLTIWLLFLCEEMLREKDPSEPKLSMHKECKRRWQKYHATPFVLDKQRDADKSLVSSHGGICGKPWTSPIFPCQTHATEFQAHVQLLARSVHRWETLPWAALLVQAWLCSGSAILHGKHICEKIGEEKAARIIKQLDLKLDNILSKLNMCDKVPLGDITTAKYMAAEVVENKDWSST